MNNSTTIVEGGAGAASSVREPSFPLLPLPSLGSRVEDGISDDDDRTPSPAEGSGSSSSETEPWSYSRDDDDDTVASSSSRGSGASVGKVAKLLAKKPRGGLKKIGRAVSGGSSRSGSGSDRDRSSSSEPPPPPPPVVVVRGGGGGGPPPRRDSIAPAARKRTVRSRRKKKKKRNSFAGAAVLTPHPSGRRLERINSARLTALNRAKTAVDPRPTTSARNVAALRRSDPEMDRVSERQLPSQKSRSSRDVPAPRFGESRFETMRFGNSRKGPLAAAEAPPPDDGRVGPSTRLMGSLCADDSGVEEEDDAIAKLRDLTPQGAPTEPPTTTASPASSSSPAPPVPPPPPRALPRSGAGKGGGGVGGSSKVGRSVARRWENAKKKALKRRNEKQQKPHFDLRDMEKGGGRSSSQESSDGTSRGGSEDGSSVASTDSSTMRGGAHTREELLHDAKLKFNLGKVYLHTGHWDKAKETLNKALRARMMLFGVDSFRVGEVHELLGDLAVKRGKIGVGRRHYNAALRMMDADLKKRKKESKTIRWDETDKERALRIANDRGNVNQRAMDQIAAMRKRVKKSLNDLPPPPVTDDSSGDASSVASSSVGLPTLAPRKSRGNPNQSVMAPAMTEEMRNDLAKLERFLPPPPEDNEEATDAKPPPLPPPPPAALTPAGLKKSSSYTDFEAERKRRCSSVRRDRAAVVARGAGKFPAIDGGETAESPATERRAGATAAAARRRSKERLEELDDEEEEDGSDDGAVPRFVVEPRRHPRRDASSTASASREGGGFRVSSLTMTDVSSTAGGGGARTESGARRGPSTGGFCVSSLTTTDFPTAANGGGAQTESGLRFPSTDGHRDARKRGNDASSDSFFAAREKFLAGSRDEAIDEDDDDVDSVASEPVGEREKVESRRKSMSSSNAAMYRALAATATNGDGEPDEEDSAGLSESERYWNIEPDEREAMPKVRFCSTERAEGSRGTREASSRSSYHERLDCRAPRDIYRSGLLHAQRGSFRSASMRFRRILDNSSEDAANGRRGSEANEVVPLVLNSLGNIRYQQGNYEAAIEFYKRSLRGRMDQVDDPDHRREIAVTIANVGKAYLELDDFDGAVKCFNRAVKMLWTSKAKDRETVVAFLVGMLGTAHYRKGDYETAMKFFAKSVSAKKKILKDESHPDILISRRDVGLCLFQLGRLKESLELFERLLAGWTAGDDDVDHRASASAVDRNAEIALLLLDMAEVHLEWGGAKHTADASELLEASLRLMDDGAGRPPDDDDDRPWRSRAMRLSSRLLARQ